MIIIKINNKTKIRQVELLTYQKFSWIKDVWMTKKTRIMAIRSEVVDLKYTV